LSHWYLAYLFVLVDTYILAYFGKIWIKLQINLLMQNSIIKKILKKSYKKLGFSIGKIPLCV